ncbi:bifunctional ADP-dependent (S)-NAD(P)H-hydrate dehydratase/NAD(P)H-hydrate epimerase [Burkholderia savannae]|uniref:Bifunctional NAD(P)H-hydrate repair enzyme n=1 Tax=Burkholderia savannae TaxID=1637837 RepID=A0ABR5TKX2_9BURK|nr:NAD(P)H-hydrate dehydratase [Burkholderia savannae]KWZ44789.1 bifunctional ADP-dependent (S)-NAD(P)H-hydrate dehydratase/NAD(P)H-hydrate epimerase [Burkholderia savannae]
MILSADSAPPPSPEPFDAPPIHASEPLLTVAELRDVETAATATLPPHTLMDRAGKSAAQWLAARLVSDPRPVWFAVGPGNNGGDALVAAAELRRLGFAADAWMPIEAKPDDARWALERARAANVPIDEAAPESFDGYGWLVDGLFGIGLARPLDGAYAAIAQRIAARARHTGRVLALDVPSGLDSDTGMRVGAGPAVAATDTLSFIAAKPGLYTGDGRDLAGEIHVAPLDLDEAVAPAIRLNAPDLFDACLPERAFASHKGTYGSVAIVGGDTGMCGAPILAARAALFAGAGKVHVGFVGAGAPPYDPPYPELMLHPADALPTAALTALAIGCGLGASEHAAHTLAALLRLNAPKLIDADALNLIAKTPELADALAARGRAGDAAVLTPHPLEAARLLSTDAADVQRDRVAAARALAARFSAIVALKGSGTVIAAPDGRVAINPTGNAALATGGTGDVLGGLIGAFLAQRMPRYEAALAGVYLHGLAAERLCAAGAGPTGTAAGELAAAVRLLINRLFYTRPATSGQAPLY